MDDSDLDTLKANEKVRFGDKALIIKKKTWKIMGNDNEWYDFI